MLFIYLLAVVVFDHCSLISIYQRQVCWARRSFISTDLLKFPESFSAILLCRDASFIGRQLPRNSLHARWASFYPGHTWRCAKYCSTHRTAPKNTFIAESSTLMFRAASVFIPYPQYMSLFLHNECQYDTRSFMARAKADVVRGVTTRGQAALTDAETNSIWSVQVSCFWD